MISNYELEFRGVATIVPKKGAEVPVLLWEIDQRDELSLDCYEGFPRMYRKELFEVEVDGRIREGMAYLMNYGEIAPPSPMYYNGIKKGYEANGMDTSYLKTALEQAVAYSQAKTMQEDEDFTEDLDAEDMDETDDFRMIFE